MPPARNAGHDFGRFPPLCWPDVFCKFRPAQPKPAMSKVVTILRMPVIGRVFLLFALCILVVPASAQDELDETQVVGFGCFYAGRETKAVEKFGKLLRWNRYGRIRRMLHSENTAERFMAVLCLERLADSGRVTITSGEEILIDRIKASTALLNICSGCFVYPATLSDAFDSDILWRKKDWLARYVKD